MLNAATYPTDAEVAYQSLQSLIVEKRNEILRRWIHALEHDRGTLEPLPGELHEHLPMFLDDLAVALDALPPRDRSQEFRPSLHGRQLLRVGFDVDAVVREYGLLGDVILCVAESVNYRPTVDEQRTLLRELSEAASHAIASYVRRRDDDLRKESGKHIAFVAHELRSPLSAASTALALSKSDGSLGAKPVQVLGRSIGRLRDLIDNVLVAGRLDSHVELSVERVPIGELLSHVHADVLPHAEAREVAVDCDDAGSLMVEGDRRLLISALGNLAHNAVKFTAPGGHVAMRARELDSRIVLEVDDQCGGLPPGKAEELFQPFVQRGNDRTGFGLGLSIAKHAIGAHGGTIRIVDRPGAGCTFVIEIPNAIPPRKGAG